MRIILIIYAVTIILFWIGALSIFTTVYKWMKANPSKHIQNKISTFSAILQLVFYSLIPIFNFIIAGYWILNTERTIEYLEENSEDA